MSRRTSLAWWREQLAATGQWQIKTVERIVRIVKHENYDITTQDINAIAMYELLIAIASAILREHPDAAARKHLQAEVRAAALHLAHQFFGSIFVDEDYLDFFKEENCVDFVDRSLRHSLAAIHRCLAMAHGTIVLNGEEWYKADAESIYQLLRFLQNNTN